MVIGRSIHGMWGIEYRNEYQSSGDYVEKMWRGALQAIEFEKRAYTNILVLGSGAGCVIHCMQNMLGAQRKNTHIIGIDWDTVMLQMGTAVYGENFLHKRNLKNLMRFVSDNTKNLVASENITLICTDAAEYVRQTEDSFDLIIVDIFHDTRPAPCMVEGAFRDTLATRLSPDGSILLNCWRSQDELRGIWNKRFIIRKEIRSHWNNLLYMKPYYATH